MIKLAFSLAACVAVLIAVSSSTVLAEQSNSVGTVVQVMGTANVVSSGVVDKPAVSRTLIFPGDRLVTGDNSWVTINFFDLTRVVLSPNSDFLIQRFPQTLSSGGVELEIKSGGARITTGTLSNESPDRFIVQTPAGEIVSSRSEWLVRICKDADCDRLHKTFKRCANYAHPTTINRQFVGVYKGRVALDYCAPKQEVVAGSTATSSLNQASCQVLDEVPCFILSDGKLGGGKLRKLLPKLTPQEPSAYREPSADGELSTIKNQPKTKERPSMRPKRPESRPPTVRPRVNRP